MATFRARILSGYLLQVGLILLIFSTALYLVTRWRLTSELDTYLDERLRYLGARLKLDDGDEIEFVVYEADHPPDLFWRVALGDGKVLGRSAAYPDLELDREVSPGGARVSPGSGEDSGEIRFADIRTRNGTPLRIAHRNVTLGGRPRRFEVEWKIDDSEPDLEEKPPKSAAQTVEVLLSAGMSLEARNDAMLALLTILAVAVPATLVLSTAGGLRLVRRAIAPITGLTRSAEQIGPENLSGRVSVGEENDEIAHLSSVMNDMLLRIEAGFQREREFTSGASHELRTPLTALQGDLEVALRRDRTAGEYREVIGRALEDARRLERLISDLLFLARADAGQLRAARDELNWPRLLSSAIKDVSQNRVDIDVSVAVSASRAHGDAGLMEVLVRNLLDNAVRYGAPPIRVTVEETASGIELRVKDSGPGVPAEALPRLFDRFYRVDRARSRRSGGCGLGLAIAKSIAAVHGGRIHAANLPGGGACFTVELPATR